MIQGEIGHGDGVVGAVSVCEVEGEKTNRMDLLSLMNELRIISLRRFKTGEARMTKIMMMMMMMIKVFTYGVVGWEVVPPHAGAGRAAAVPAPLQSGHAGRQSPRNKPLQFLPSTSRSPTPFTLKSVLAGIYFVPKKMQVIQSV